MLSQKQGKWKEQVLYVKEIKRLPLEQTYKGKLYELLKVDPASCSHILHNRHLLYYET